MIKVIYSKDGSPISDFEVESMSKKVIEDYLKDSEKDIVEVIVNTSNETYLQAFALCVMEGFIEESEIQFFIEDTSVYFDEWFGLITPKGFENYFPNSNINERILKLGYDKMKESRKKRLNCEM